MENTNQNRNNHDGCCSLSELGVLVVTIVIVPVASRQISADLVVLLGIFDDLHIQVHYSHAFSMTAQSHQWPSVWHHDLRQPSVAFTWRASGVGEDDGCKVC